MMFDQDELHEECGIFSIFNADDAAAHTVLGLHALQHRGQEGAGIVTCEENAFHSHFCKGLVGENLSQENIISTLKGRNAIGHVRYSTTGSKTTNYFQPLTAEYEFGKLAIAHNGNIPNASQIKDDLISKGAIFKSDTDSEIFIHLLAQSNKKTLVERLIETVNKIQGAFSLTIMTQNEIIAIKDPHGIRPLALGKLDDSYIFASESCAFDIINAKYIREIEPGEIVVINKDGIKSLKPFQQKPEKFCIFEYIYFARPDSYLNNRDVYAVRKNIGHELAKENHIDADIVVPVPDSGVPSALGYAEETNLPLELGIIRNHYVGRTFIEPTQNIRHLGVRLKHNANKRIIKGKKIILVDDSIVRGTTSKKIVEMLKSAGAKEIHLRISSPPTTHSCFYGVDTPDRDKLIAANHNIAEMCKQIGATSLAFISLDGLYNAISQEKRNNKNSQYCDACFSGEYPIEITS
jgi:amidophosphoribosyltransferase